MASGGFCIHDKESKSLVVAITLGTTFSGYAFSWKADYNKDPCHVFVAPYWAAGSTSVVSMMAPTCVLFDENKNFHSFGYKAEDAYSELALDGEQEKWYFFKRFRMRLHVKRRLRDTELEDDKGRTMPAIKVFAEVIRYLKCHLFELNKIRLTEITDDDVHFILTVPAIWTDYAKQFMREAASEAGIDGGQLSIVLEPEAASLYCQLLPTERLLGSEGAKFALASPGTKYMVIDLGDGTTDITVHERLPDGGLKELYKVSGDVWGGIKVEEEFNKLLVAIVGAPAFQAFFDQNKSDQLDLYMELEAKKRQITPNSTGKITVKVPVSLASTFDKENQLGESISDAIENSPYKGKVRWIRDKMRIDAEVFKAMFKPCCKKVVEHIKDLLTKKEVKGTSLFLMVGGFSECSMIQDAVMKAFPNYKVIIPEEAGLAVLKGAVIFGHRPVCI